MRIQSKKYGDRGTRISIYPWSGRRTSGSVGSSRSPNQQMDQSPERANRICFKGHSKGVTWTVHPSHPKSVVFRVSARFPIGIIYESFHFFLAKIHQNSTALGCNVRTMTPPFRWSESPHLCLCRAQVQTAPMQLGVPWLSCSAPWPPCVVESVARPVGWTASVVAAAPVAQLGASGETSSPCESSSPLAHLRCSERCGAVETRDQWWAVQIATFGIQFGCLLITTLSWDFAVLPVFAANPAQFQCSWI